MDLNRETGEAIGPYGDAALNSIYELLFCDKLESYQKIIRQPGLPVWNILLSDTATVSELQEIIGADNAETRIKLLAWHKMRTVGYPVAKKELLAVIVELGLREGLDVLATYTDGTARYINHSGKLLIWESPDQQSNALIDKLFDASIGVVRQIGPWDQARRPHPTMGSVRISFLVSDGLYFGEGAINDLFNDPLAGPVLLAATEVMRYIVEKALP